MTLSVIGAGLGRTGTLSTKAALEQLGLGRCYHMLEVGLNPDHPVEWERALDGDCIAWDALFADYRACLDWPACFFWPALVAAFPEARVVLTVRDPEAWCASFRDTIGRVLEPPFPPGAVSILQMAARVIIDGTFGGTLGNDAHLIACYEEHNRRVIDTVDPDRLLVFDVRQGWEPLCAFLGSPVPDEPYPNLNDRGFFHAMIAGDEPPRVVPAESL